jgi:hypothetical protein
MDAGDWCDGRKIRVTATAIYNLKRRRVVSLSTDFESAQDLLRMIGPADSA